MVQAAPLDKGLVFGPAPSPHLTAGEAEIPWDGEPDFKKLTLEPIFPNCLDS